MGMRLSRLMTASRFSGYERNGQGLPSANERSREWPSKGLDPFVDSRLSPAHLLLILEDSMEGSMNEAKKKVIIADLEVLANTLGIYCEGDTPGYFASLPCSCDQLAECGGPWPLIGCCPSCKAKEVLEGNKNDWRKAIGAAPATPGSISPEEAIRRARGDSG